MSSSSFLILVACFVGGIAGDVLVDDDPLAHGAIPPPPPPGPPGPPGLPVGIPAAFGGFPGLGAGFHKSLDISGGAGYGLPFLGGGFGGVPPPGPIPVDAGVFPDGGVFGGGFGAPFGLLGPSYIPSTWIGSALGAKGDLLFPIVIFVFFIVGIWTVVQFLLGLIVPLIAAKFSVLNSVVRPFSRRDTGGSADSGSGVSQADIDNLTQAVYDAIDKQKSSDDGSVDSDTV